MRTAQWPTRRLIRFGVLHVHIADTMEKTGCTSRGHNFARYKKNTSPTTKEQRERTTAECAQRPPPQICETARTTARSCAQGKEAVATPNTECVTKTSRVEKVLQCQLRRTPRA